MAYPHFWFLFYRYNSQIVEHFIKKCYEQKTLYYQIIYNSSSNHFFFFVSVKETEIDERQKQTLFLIKNQRFSLCQALKHFLAEKDLSVKSQYYPKNFLADITQEAFKFFSSNWKKFSHCIKTYRLSLLVFAVISLKT